MRLKFALENSLKVPGRFELLLKALQISLSSFWHLYDYNTPVGFDKIDLVRKGKGIRPLYAQYEI